MQTIKNYLSILLVFLPCLVSAQEEMTGLLFEQFTRGTVVMTDGTSSEAMLNYNSLMQQMCFIGPDGSILAIADPAKVSVIVINGRRFHPLKNDIFVERVPMSTNGSFYVQWKSVLWSRAKSTGYGATTSAATTNVGYLSKQATLLSSTEMFEGRVENSFYIKDAKNKYKKFNSAKSLGKLFPGHENEIAWFASEQAIDFNNIGDISRIVEYAYGL